MLCQIIQFNASPPSPDQERKSSAPDSAPSSTHFQRLSFATAALIKSGAVACFTSPLNRRWSSSKGHLHQLVGHQQPPSSFSTAHYISHFAWRFSTPRPPTQALIHSPQPSTSFTPTVPVQPPRQSSRQRGLLPNLTTTILAVRRTSATEGVGESKQPTFSPKHQTGLILPLQPSDPFNLLLLQTTLISSPPPTLLPNSNQIRHQLSRSLKSKTAATMVGGPKEFGGTKAFKPLVQRDVIVSFGPPEIIVLSLKFHHSRSSAHYHFDIIIIQYFRLLK